MLPDTGNGLMAGQVQPATMTSGQQISACGMPTTRAVLGAGFSVAATRDVIGTGQVKVSGGGPRPGSTRGGVCGTKEARSVGTGTPAQGT
jgi:hypothetical protein